MQIFAGYSQTVFHSDYFEQREPIIHSRPPESARKLCAIQNEIKCHMFNVLV